MPQRLAIFHQKQTCTGDGRWRVVVRSRPGLPLPSRAPWTPCSLQSFIRRSMARGLARARTRLPRGLNSPVPHCRTETARPVVLPTYARAAMLPARRTDALPAVRWTRSLGLSYWDRSRVVGIPSIKWPCMARGRLIRNRETIWGRVTGRQERGRHQMISPVARGKGLEGVGCREAMTCMQHDVQLSCRAMYIRER